MTLIYNKRLSDDVPHYIIGYHDRYDNYVTDMTDYKVRTEKDNENTQTIGLEIELGRSKEITRNMIEKMMEICPFIQCSSDGSIPARYNTELQVAPMTINAIQESGLKELFKWLRDHDFTASIITNLDSGDGCGGHIHISKGDKWEDIVTLMAMFIDQNKEIVQIICKRPFTNYAVNNLRGLGKSTKRYSLTGVKEYMLNNTSNHSNTLNLQHRDTIEFRLPVGTINWTTKMAHIEFITNLYKCCEDVVNGNARLDRLTINKVCQDGEYLPKYMKELCISCSKKLIVLDNEIKKKVRTLESDKLKLIKVLSDLQYALGTTNDSEIRQGSINTINNRLMEITNATTLDALLIYIKNMKDATNISDGLELYIQTHDNNIAKYYKQLKDLVNNINVENIYHDILEEV